MKKKKITFRCDGATLPQIGTGHVRRAIAIADMLVKKKICLSKEISFVTRRLRSFKLGYGLVKKAGYYVENIEDKNLEWNSKQEASFLSKLKSDILVLDRLSTTRNWMSHLTGKFRTLVSMDDIGSGAKIADLVINGILHDLSPKKNRYIGYKYLFLKNTNLLLKKKNTKKVNNIVVSFGGYDKRNLTKFFLNSLLHKNFLLERSLNIELLVGDAHHKAINTWKKLIKSILTNHKIKINLVVFSSDYFKRLAKADLAVVSGGLTVFDSISRGVPVIGLPQYKHQLKTLINLESKRVIKLGSLGMRLDKKNFINLFNKMIISFEDRIFLSKNSIKLFDRKGSDRVLNILSSLF